MALSPGWRATSKTWLSVPWMAHGPARRAAVIAGSRVEVWVGRVGSEGSSDRVEYMMDVGLTSGAVAYIINLVALPKVDVVTVTIVACRHGAAGLSVTPRFAKKSACGFR